MPQIFVDFRPAEVVNGKETYVTFYALNPHSRKLERKRVRCNHIKGKNERLKYARLICSNINQRLYDGWNPFYDGLDGVDMQTALKAFMNMKIKEVRSDTTRVYVSIVNIFTRWLDKNGMLNSPCMMFNRKNAEKYMNSLADNPKMGNRSYNNHLRCLKTVFCSMKERGRIHENPFDHISPKRCDKKLRTIIPADDRRMIREYLQVNNPSFYICCLLCYRCFIRPKEMLMLKMSMYDFDENLLHIPADVSKNHNERIIALPDEIRNYLYTLKSYPGSFYIFSDKDTFKPGRSRLDSKRIGRIWGYMREKLNLPASYQFYSLKDTGITEMLEAGVPAKYVKELADHHSLEMTEKYTHKSEAKKILEWNKLEF